VCTAVYGVWKYDDDAMPVCLLCLPMYVANHASDNDIGDEPATALASALERNKSLQHLDAHGASECRRVCCLIDDGP
jgi:hypothetical protein